MDKRISRLRRSVPTRRKIAELCVHRLTVFRSNQHIYANIISPEGNRVLVSASTVEPEIRQQLDGQTGGGGNASAATLVGKRVAERAKAAGIELVHSIARVSVITVALKRWPKRLVKPV